MSPQKHITIKIYEDDRVEILDEQNKSVPVVPTGSIHHKQFIGPQNCYEQIMWHIGSPICIWHRGRLH